MSYFKLHPSLKWCMDIFAVNCRKNSGKSWGNYTIVSSAHSIFMHLLCSLFLKFTLKFWKSFWPLRRKHLQLRILPRVVNSFSIQAEVSTFLYLRATAFDFCKVKRGKDGGTLRTMSGEKLLKTLPVLQAQVCTWLIFSIIFCHLRYYSIMFWKYLSYALLI